MAEHSLLQEMVDPLEFRSFEVLSQRGGISSTRDHPMASFSGAYLFPLSCAPITEVSILSSRPAGEESIPTGVCISWLLSLTRLSDLGGTVSGLVKTLVSNQVSAQ